MKSDLSRRDVLKLGSIAQFSAPVARTGRPWGARRRRRFLRRRRLPGPMPRENTACPRCLTTYNALEPLYDEKTLRLHYDKHHATYVTGLNEALQKLAAARKTNDYRSIQSLCDCNWPSTAAATSCTRSSGTP